MNPPSPSTRAEETAPLVLIVDDSDLNRKLAREVLRAAGLRTIEAATAAAGIAAAADGSPDVILLDLQLPDMDGTDVARRLRQDTRTAELPIVAWSASRHFGDQTRLLALGFSGYLEKPIDVGAFPEQVLSYYHRAARS